MDNSSSSSFVARLIWVLAKPSIPNSFITALALRIETPLIYISATAQKTVRLELRPCSRDCGKNGAPHSSKVVGGLRYNHAQSVPRSINLFALVTIGIAQSPRNRFRIPTPKNYSRSIRMVRPNSRINTDAISSDPLDIICSINSLITVS